MTKICVFSDSHGFSDYMIRAVSQETPDGIVFLGDGERDMDRTEKQFPSLPVYRVRGNCDRYSNAPLVLQTLLAGKKVFATHGHYYEVKYDPAYSTLRYAAMEADADIVLFGHTHIPFQDTSLGMVVLNPGTISHISAPTYGVIEVEKGNITAAIRPVP